MECSNDDRVCRGKVWELNAGVMEREDLGELGKKELCVIGSLGHLKDILEEVAK